MSIMPSVAMNGGILSTATLKPLTKPSSAPKAIAPSTPAHSGQPQ